MDKPSYRLLLFDFTFDSLSYANRLLLSDVRAVRESSLYSQILLLIRQQQAFHTEAIREAVIHIQWPRILAQEALNDELTSQHHHMLTVT